MSRSELICRYFDHSDSLLELGPSYNPIAPKSDGWNTVIIDHASQEDLVEKYTGMGVEGVNRIEPVDFIWQAGPLLALIPKELHGTFDGLIASHVCEHLPDLIAFLQDASALLKGDGLIALALPDKRVCFDFFQPLTTTGDLLAAHTERRVRHQRRTFFNQAAYFVSRNGEGGWAHAEKAAPFHLNNTLGQAQQAYDEADEGPGSDYRDTHAWTFTPKSFELLVLELNLLGHIDWAIRAIEPAPGVEFYVWLERRRLAMADAETNRVRLSLLTAIGWESRDAIVQLSGFIGTTDPARQMPGVADADSGEPSIAVVIPLFNGSDYIEQALQSVFRQTLPPTEIVVVNDGSTDSGAEIVERLAKEHPVTLLHRPNQGQSAARNVGVRASSSQLIAFLDQDDIWYRTHLEELVKPFLSPADPPVGWVYSNLDEIDKDGHLVCRSFLNLMPASHPKKQLSDLISENMFILPSASLISREAFELAGGFDERLCGYEDDDLFMRIFRRGYDNVYISRALSQWRIYPASASYSSRFAESRSIYCQKLLDLFPNDKQLGRYYTRDMIVPRFQAEALRDYEAALSSGEASRIAAAREELLELSAGSPPIISAMLERALKHYKRMLSSRDNHGITVIWNELIRLTSHTPQKHTRLRLTLGMLRSPIISRLAFAARGMLRPAMLWAFRAEPSPKPSQSATA
ncbi:MAG TPA: glycosyltransferase [Acetobacteraceae bacterium]|jgi:glycosyltransferase involved in cell wall biosynthesis/SAM-dependent methyltransferase